MQNKIYATVKFTKEHYTKTTKRTLINGGSSTSKLKIMIQIVQMTSEATLKKLRERWHVTDKAFWSQTLTQTHKMNYKIENTVSKDNSI